ncbi:lipoprotein-releasing ABC transporter permease subunit [Pararhodospirillum photometricum]|nr:lipoprotein-releasing ABC transporter permease subunit [Pararhodospirillum photometricum]
MIFNSFERLMAGRYLRARRKEGFVSVIAGFSLAGIALGVATLIIVMAVMNGFREDLMSRIFGLNGHLSVFGPTEVLTDYDRLTQAVRTVPGVETVTPTVEGQVMLSANGVSLGGLVRGARSEDLKARHVLSRALVAGSLDDLEGQDAIMIGSRLASRFNLVVGDKLTLISPRGKITAFGSVPSIRAYTVRAIFSVGMSEYDSSFVFLPLEAAQTYFQVPANGVHHLEVEVSEPERVGAVTQALVELGAKQGLSLRLRDWRETNATFFNALQVERNVMFLILTLIILVAAFNIISGLIMLVKDKGRDIAILRTMGASRGAIMRIFFLAGASVGTLGTGIGLLLGVLFCENIEAIRQGLQSLLGVELFSAEVYFLATMPARMEGHEVMQVVGLALGLSFAATLYPAWRAARTDPVEALRHE